LNLIRFLSAQFSSLSRFSSHCVKSKGQYSSSRKKQADTLNFHDQNSTTVTLHVFSRVPCTTQDAPISPCLFPGLSLRHVLSPFPDMEHTGLWPGRSGMDSAHSAAFPFCKAHVQVSVLPQSSSFKKYVGVSCL